MKDPKDITIAFLFDEIYNEYSSGICRGVLHASKELGISIIFFGVGTLQSPVLNTSMRNKLFSLLNPSDFQGILYISSSISNFVGAKKFLEYIKKYGNIPTAHIGILVPDKCSFNIDNGSGMYSVINHIIAEHNRKKIAFISGTKGVQEADDRFNSYKKALADNGIPFDEKYVYEGNFLRDSGILAVEEFLDKRKIEFDALIGANDHMALYAMKELQKRGYRIPEDISIGGFDDLASSKSHVPALTTVHQPADKLGYTAICEFVAKIINSDNTPCDIRLPAEMIVRQSCGCIEKSAGDIKPDSWLLPDLSPSERDELDSALNIMTRDIIGTFEESELRKVLDENLKIFDIKEFSLAKYVDQSNSIVFYSNQGVVNHQFPSNYLVENKIASFNRPFIKFLLPLYYRNEDIGFFISDIGYKALSVLEIIRDQLSGALKGARLLEDAKLYAESLEKMVDERTKELANRSNELEQALYSIKLASEKLERLSVIDELTGLYNRRGFITVAKQQVELIKRNNYDVLLVFLDLDGLKHINDNFGHAAGDIAIKAMANILTKVFRQTDIIARIGGDEFTVLAISCSMNEYNTILERAENMVNEYNLTSGQNFRLSFSSGAAPALSGKYFSLEELMEEADTNLYKTKREKKKNR